MKVGDRVKVVAKRKDLPPTVGQHAGDEGVLINIRREIGQTYYLVSFGEDDHAAYLLNEIEKVG